MDVRAYVTEPQLSRDALGQEARVTIDARGGARQTLSGAVSWICRDRGVHADADSDARRARRHRLRDQDPRRQPQRRC